MGMRNEGPRELIPGIFWLGSSQSNDDLQINVYAIVRDGVTVLLEPGPAKTFHEISDALLEMTGSPVPQLIIVSHQDPDICSSLPLWEASGYDGPVFAHWKTVALVSAYGTGNPLIGMGRGQELPEQLAKLSLQVIPADFLHAPGAIALFDSATKILFSGDLFGALNGSEDLFFRIDDLDRLEGFHELYMPVTEFLGDFIAEIKKMDIRMICPQHGMVIDSFFGEIFSRLENTRCGRSGSGFATERERLGRELHQLRMDNFELQKNLILSNDNKILDAVTGLYNQAYFDACFPAFHQSNPDGYFYCIRLDGMKDFNSLYGSAEGDAAISHLARIVMDRKSEDSMIFRASGPQVSLLIPAGDFEKICDGINEILKEINESDGFIHAMTGSAVLISFSSLSGENVSVSEALQAELRKRLNELDRRGEGSFLTGSEEEDEFEGKDLIVVLDSDRINSQFLKDFLERRGYRVLICDDGRDAVQIIEKNRPALIVSEIHISPADAFQVRLRLMESYDLKKIPFLLLSHIKSDIFIKRAFHMEIYHYLKKPVSLVELEGLVAYLVGMNHDN